MGAAQPEEGDLPGLSRGSLRGGGSASRARTTLLDGESCLAGNSGLCSPSISGFGEWGACGRSAYPIAPPTPIPLFYLSAALPVKDQLEKEKVALMLFVICHQIWLEDGQLYKCYK